MTKEGFFFQLVNRIGLDLIVEKVRAFCQFETPPSRPDTSYLTSQCLPPHRPSQYRRILRRANSFNIDLQRRTRRD